MCAYTSLKRLTHSFNVVIRHTRSTRTLAFTQASSFFKLSVPPAYVILVWCVFSKPCTKLTLHRAALLPSFLTRLTPPYTLTLELLEMLRHDRSELIRAFVCMCEYSCYKIHGNMVSC
jgi:hypothetical protein